MAEPGISPRQQVAQNLADTCIFGDLNDSYGVSMERGTSSTGKAHWSVLFAKARVLDGVIEVYSPNFILVKWQTSLRDLPERGKEVFKTELDAKKFILDSFVRL
jgi:hypothetical protein